MTDSALFIVEGSKAEPRLLKKMYREYVGKNAEVVSYGTNIHVLMDSLFDGDDLDEDLDVMKIIRELDPNSDIPSRRFTDIYLVFDMDPHDPKFDPKRLRSLLRFFDDSADNGKLFINYPMLESYRHLKCPWDQDYVGRMVSFRDSHDYKTIVDRESYPEIKQLNRHDRALYDMLIRMNLDKMGFLIYGNPLTGSSDYLAIGATEVFDMIMYHLDNQGLIPVLNTSLFIPVDYNPFLFFNR